MAYQQIVVNQRSRRYLTINTTRGLFTFNRLPAGICAAPGIFQRIMDGLFSNVEGVVCNNYVKSCDNFQSVSAVSTMSTIHPWEWPGKSWIRIHIDYAGPFNGKMYLIVIDSYSKWIEIIPTTSATAEATVTILREIFLRWGLPLMIVSDNATCFTSYIFTDFCKHNAIKHITSSPHHPSTNGLAERAVQVFKHGVKKITGDIVIFCYIIEVAHRAQLGKHHLC